MSTNTSPRPVLVTTTHKGVFFGYVSESTTNKESFNLKQAKMAIYWGTTKGVMQLANTGPTSLSIISKPADIEVRGVNLVMEVTPEAEEVWKKA